MSLIIAAFLILVSINLKSEKDSLNNLKENLINEIHESLSKEEKNLLKGIALYRIPVHRDAPGIHEVTNIRRVRKKLTHLSLAMYIPVETYYTYRLVSDYVVTHLYEPGELKKIRIQAGTYLKDKNPFFSSARLLV